MNTFGQGFNLGFASGLFNNLFGGCSMFGFNGYMANPFCNYSFSPMFFTPTFSFGPFVPYSNPSNIFNTFSYMGGMNAGSIWNTPMYNNSIWGQSIITQQTQYNENIFGYTSKPSTSGENKPVSIHSTTSTTSTQVGAQSTVKSTTTSNTGAQGSDGVKKAAETKPPKKKSKSTTQASVTAREMAAKWNRKYPNAKNITKEFCQKVIDISEEIQCEPEDLMALMNLESGHTFDPAQKNRGGHEYYGLIQFGERAAQDVGKTLDELKSMSAIEQLDYVKKYLLIQKNAKKIEGKLDTTTLYCLVFYPKASTQSDDYVIAQKDSEKSGRRYNANKGLDVDNSNTITRGELDRALDAYRV